MKLRCIIIDDEEFAINAIKRVIDELSNEYPLEIIKTYSSSLQAINEINDISFDLLFIDYDMRPYNGVEVVSKLKKEVSVIFVTSHRDKSIDIGNLVNIEGFLTKPPEIKTLRNIFKSKNLVSKTSNKIEKIVIPDGKNNLYFDKKEIYYIESKGDTKKIFDINQKIISFVDISFNNLENILQHHGFQRVSRNFIVNLDHIRKRTQTTIYLKNGKEISVGETKKESLFKRLKNIFK